MDQGILIVSGLPRSGTSLMMQMLKNGGVEVVTDGIRSADADNRIVFMERDLEETLLSQEKMLTRLGRIAAPREQMKRALTLHLERLHEWLSLQGNMEVLLVRYNDLVGQPCEQTGRVGEFIGGNLDVEAMVKTVDLSLYRNRKTSGVMDPTNSA
jgi:hypothetical protein